MERLKMTDRISQRKIQIDNKLKISKKINVKEECKESPLTLIEEQNSQNYEGLLQENKNLSEMNENQKKEIKELKKIIFDLNEEKSEFKESENRIIPPTQKANVKKNDFEK